MQYAQISEVILTKITNIRIISENSKYDHLLKDIRAGGDLPIAYENIQDAFRVLNEYAAGTRPFHNGDRTWERSFMVLTLFTAEAARFDPIRALFQNIINNRGGANDPTWREPDRTFQNHFVQNGHHFRRLLNSYARIRNFINGRGGGAVANRVTNPNR